MRQNQGWLLLPTMMAVALLVGCGGGGGKTSAADANGGTYNLCTPSGDCTTVTIPSQAPPEQRCILFWNRDADNAETVQREIVTMASAGNVYISVQFAADYPDLCLVTAVSPALGTGYQFLETDSPGIGHVYLPKGPVDPANLDPSVSDWNAQVINSEVGDLTLKSYRIDLFGED